VSGLALQSNRWKDVSSEPSAATDCAEFTPRGYASWEPSHRAGSRSRGSGDPCWMSPTGRTC